MWAGKLLKKLPFISFCTWVEADVQFMVKLNSSVWEAQWNGNPQSGFCCRFICFLRARGSFISTSAMGVSWLFLIPGPAPTAVEVAGSLAFIRACCHFNPCHSSNASSLAWCPWRYWAPLAVLCVPGLHSPLLSSCQERQKAACKEGIWMVCPRLQNAHCLTGQWKGGGVCKAVW